MARRISLVTNPGNGLREIIDRNRSGDLADTFLMRLTRAYRERGYDVSFITFDKRPVEWDGVPVHVNAAGGNSLLHALLLPWRLRRVPRADVYNPRNMSASLYAVYLRLFRGGAVITRCGYDWEYFAGRDGGALYRLFVRLWCRLTYRWSDALYVTSRVHYEKAVRFAAPERVFLIPNAVDNRRFFPEERPRQPRSILTVGRLEPQKNLHAVIEACAGLADVTLHLVGDGNLRRALEELAAARRVHAVFHGYLPAERVAQLLNETTLFLLASLYEGASHALIEAMFTRAAIVASDIAANAEIIAHRETGLLCGTDAPAIQGALRTMLEDESLRRSCAEKAYEKAMATYTFDRMFEAKLGMIDAVLAAQGRA